MAVLALPASFRVGIEDFDADHQRLFVGMNALHDAILGGNRSRAGALMSEIGRLAIDHFEREESMLAAHRYPLLRRHTDGHEAVYDRLRHIAARLPESDWRGLADAVEGMMMVKLEGIMVADMDYRWWFEARGIEPVLPPVEPVTVALRNVINA